MADTEGRFYEAIRKVTSAQYVAMRAAGAAWDALARAAGTEGGELSASAAEAETEPGEGLLILSDRLGEAGGWADGAGTVARQIADQLMGAAERSAQATERAVQLDEEYGEVDAQLGRDIEAIDAGMAINVKTAAAEQKKEELIQRANEELDALGEEFARVIGGEAPRAPGGGAGATAAAGGYADASAADASAAGAASTAAAAGGGVAGGIAAGGAAGQASPAYAEGAAADYAAPNGSQIGAGEYPHASVLGPEQGDFAGWVQSPTTGYLVDPATGREFDPDTNRWIDPVTGQPFGEVTEYATRLAGLADGPGALATPGAGTLTAGAAAVGGAGLPGLYGGIMPPSVGPTGPARGQVMRQAVNNLNRNARVATRFALQEAAQGGRPFVPPPGAAAQRGVGPYGRGAARTTVAGATPRGGATAPAGRGAVAQGAAARSLMPPPGAAAQGGARGGARGATARGRAIGEPSSTWRAHSRQAPARYPLAGGRPGAAVPPPAPGAARGRHAPDEEESRIAPPTELTEDPEVWATRRGATGGVVGE